MLGKGYSKKDVATALGRDKSTITRELKRNRFGGKSGRGKGGLVGAYDAVAAQIKYRNRRRQAKYAGMLVYEHDELRKYVMLKLKEGWSPDTISGRMKQLGLGFYASKRAIYEYLYSPYGQRYCKYLRSHRYSKQKKKGKKKKRVLIPNRISIHDRPDTHTQYGNYEGDTIVSGKSTGSTTALATIYEPKTMYIDARKIQSLSPAHYNPAMEYMFRKLLKTISLTLDNGIENTHHEWLQTKLGIKIYFCDPYSSWQKPGIENANKLIRRFIPKGVDISRYSDTLIRKEIQKLNHTPRKALQYKTPHEVMTEHNLFKEKAKQKHH